MTVGDTTLEFKVTPVHAALLLAFAGRQAKGEEQPAAAMEDPPSSSNSRSRLRQAPRDSSAAAAAAVEAGSTSGGNEGDDVVEWDVAGLSQHLGLPPGVVRTKMLFWVTNGVLLEGRGAEGQLVYRRATSIPPGHAGKAWVGD